MGMRPSVDDGEGEGVAAGVGEEVAAADALGVGVVTAAGPPQAASTTSARIRARAITP